MKRGQRKERGKKTIFRSIFIPLILIMMLQSGIFYLAAVYGGIEESLTQNAADILSERLSNRKTELETQLNSRSFALDDCVASLRQLYAGYEASHGARAMTDDLSMQIQFLNDSADTLIDTLRHTETNGVFLILNNRRERDDGSADGARKLYGLCIRDMDQESNYSGREDLLLERSPSSLVDALGCPLDSWWEAWYTFDTPESGDYYYQPLLAAWDNPGAKGGNLAYLSGLHQISGSDQAVISYSVPLISAGGYPFGVVGVELSPKYLASLLPNSILNDRSNPSYVLGLRTAGTEIVTPVVGTGVLYKRCFGSDSVISCEKTRIDTGGFTVVGRGDTELYGDDAVLTVYNNNNPFENRQLVLLALAESSVLFAYIGQIKLALGLATLFCLLLGVASIFFVSRRFASPITNLAKRARDLKPEQGFHLGRLGIVEIDQLVASIEELNQNVSRSSARTEFFSRMSHDMRTPMNAIIGFSSPELLDGASERTKNDYLEKIHNSGEYLLGLINEVLDMTKIESNNVELHAVTVEAAKLCDTAIPVIEKLAQKKDVAFTSDIAIPPGVFVKTDAQHFSQIVMNLLSNAVKFTPGGGAVRLCVSMEPDGRCRVVVSDNGVGMSPEFMRNLYTPFERESSVGEGTGLGLSITKKLVELMGGSVECESRQNVGTTFTVTLPLTKGDATAAEPSDAPPPKADMEVLRGKRLLVCEDNAINAQIVTHLLSRIGILSEVAENGRVGVDKFSSAPAGTYDAILMDIRMPVMDGLEATRLIRALPRPDAARIPILAMTANAFDEDARASRAVGMNEHLSKPIETKKFFDALLRYLGGENEAGASR